MTTPRPPRPRRRRADWGIFFFLVALAIGNAFAFVLVDDTREDGDRALAGAALKNCARIHLLDVTLEDIVISAQDSLRKYEAEGTITPEQLQRGLEDNARARLKLIGADCPPRSR